MKSVKLQPYMVTVVGALGAAFGFVSSPQFLALIPPKWAAVITLAGSVLTAFGVHWGHAQTQSMLVQLGATTPGATPKP